MGIITVTERQVFMRCRKRWDYQSHSRQNLEPLITPTALSTGRMIHEAHEWWLLDPEADPVELLMRSAKGELDKMKERYRVYVGAEISDDELGPFYESLEICRAMMANYKERWGSPLPDGFELVQPEQTVLVPIPGTNCANCFHAPHADSSHCEVEDCYVPDDVMGGAGWCRSYEPHQLEATFDILMRHKKSGHLFIGERKTYNQRPKIEGMRQNDQFITYIWALQQLDIGPVGGVAYDGMWKKDIGGRKGSERKLEDLFLRTILQRPQYEIDLWGQMLVHQANEMCDPNTPIYLNRQWQGCWDCPFEKLCVSESRGEDWEYMKETYFAHRKDGVVGVLDEEER